MGELIEFRITEVGVKGYYKPLAQLERKKLFEAILKDRMVDFQFPFPLFKEGVLKETRTSESGWQINSKTLNSLDRGENEFRSYTLELLQQIETKNKVLFDPACSTGTFLGSLGKKFPHFVTYGQDLSRTMVKIAADKIDHVSCQNALTPMMVSNSVDFLFCRFLNAGVVTSAFAEACFKELCKVVKKSGFIIVFGYTPVLLSSQFFIDQKLNVLQKNGITQDSKRVFQYYVLQKL
ncbi:MAG: class I SAM-dependent methyltransferase [Bacteriovorax sp.]